MPPVPQPVEKRTAQTRAAPSLKPCPIRFLLVEQLHAHDTLASRKDQQQTPEEHTQSKQEKKKNSHLSSNYPD
jgi:hypothetical protein